MTTGSVEGSTLSDGEACFCSDEPDGAAEGLGPGCGVAERFAAPRSRGVYSVVREGVCCTAIQTFN